MPAPEGAEDTRARILAVAAAAWHEASFSGVGVAELCERAGVHKGSFFHFFASKEDLLLAVLAQYRDRVRRGLEDGPFRRDAPPLARIVRFFAALGASVAADLQRTGCFRGCPIGNVASELGTRVPAVRAATAAVFDDMRAIFRGALNEAAEAGDLLPGTDVDAGATAILAFLQGLAVLGKAYGGTAPMKGLGARVLPLVGATPRAITAVAAAIGS